MKQERLYTLDALRGVAAFIVIWFHIFEGFATSPADQMLNHGYLSVDFFFLLSGYVIGFSYDNRWNGGKLTRWEFFKRRLIRLHPMVIAGTLIGAITFIMGGSQKWNGEAVSQQQFYIYRSLPQQFQPLHEHKFYHGLLNMQI